MNEYIVPISFIFLSCEKLVLLRQDLDPPNWLRARKTGVRDCKPLSDVLLDMYEVNDSWLIYI